MTQTNPKPSLAEAKPAPTVGQLNHFTDRELFERGAYYAMASFVVLYLGQLGLGDYWPSTLNGALWSLVYFLPILSGTIADQVGFKRALLVAFVLLSGGYFFMGYPVWFGGETLDPVIGSTVTAGPGVIAPIILGIVLI